MDHYCRKRLEKRTTKHKKGRDSILGNHRHATKLFRGYRGTKSAGTCINAEKMRGWGNQKWETGKRGKRVEREKEKLWAGGKERRARLAAGGSNCVINLKVRFSRERGPGARKGEGQGGRKRREKERATSECCRSVFAAESAYSFAAPYIPAKRQRGYGIAGEPPRTHPWRHAMRDHG